MPTEDRHAPGAPRPPLTDEEFAAELFALLGRHAAQLGEHLSSVQIVATYLRPNGRTALFAQGAGDLYARIGATREWLRQMDAQAP